ncbi:hypothetical protein [Comamonas aquatica]|uniref:hypothetical protein n=1 Tax=Comamonas aquatica TaxID=225991 RepID=UPI0021B0E31B|nr:hypothetical protein [Comamonas aquatica]
MTDLTMSQFASKDDLLAAQAARIAELESQLEAIGAGGVEPLRKQAVAPHEEAIAEIVSASHDQAEFGERAINFLRDFQHLEYGTKLYPAPQAVQAAVPEAIEQMAADRYKVVPSHESMFHRWAVVAGNGTQQLYIGREVECLNMARKFSGAFLDGAFVAMQNTAPAHPAESVPAQIETLRSELAEEKEAADNWRRLALQFDIHRLQALWHLKRILHADSSVDEYKAAEQFLAAPPLDGEAVLVQRIAALAATQPAPAIFGDEDHVLVPRGLIGAACYAIDKKRDGTKTLAELRRYTTGDLSAATQPAAQAVQPFGWLITKSKLPGDVEFTQDPMRENLARSFGYQTQALYDQPAAQGMEADLTDAQIDEAFNQMPDGAAGFLKSWGYRQFARAVLAAQAKQGGA